MKILTTILISSLLSFFATPAMADVKNGNSSVHVSINNNVNTQNSTNQSYSNNYTSNTHINVSENTGDTSVQVNNNDFTITGTVKSVSGATLNVSGQEVQFDPGKLSAPSVGEKVTVKGTVATNGTLTATSISTGSSSNSILGTTNSQNISSSPKPTTLASPSPSITPLPTLSPTLKPFNLLEQLAGIFKQIFSFFKIN